MMIAGAVLGLVAPRLMNTYEQIKGKAEERKLAYILNSIKMQAFARRSTCIIQFHDNTLQASNGSIQEHFKFIKFSTAKIMVNCNGFTDTAKLTYILGGREKEMDVS